MDIAVAIPAFPRTHLSSSPKLVSDNESIKHGPVRSHTYSTTDQVTSPWPNLSEKRAITPTTPQHMHLPPFQPTSALGCLEDAKGDAVDPDISGSLDKGFFLADNIWTCYRRNYFSCTCSYAFKGEDGSSSQDPQFPMAFIAAGSRTRQMVFGYAMALSAVVADGDGKAICLVQHTPKRDKGPISEPGRVRLSPKLAREASTDPVLVNPRRSPNVGAPFPTEHVFERMQFKQATANNGKRRALQQYYHIQLELWADVGGSPSERWTMVAYRTSPKLVVRGRSPGHYQAQRRESSESLFEMDPFGGLAALRYRQSLVPNALTRVTHAKAMQYYAIPESDPYQPSKLQQDVLHSKIDAEIPHMSTTNSKESSTQPGLKLPNIKVEEDQQSLERYSPSYPNDTIDSITRTCNSLNDLTIVGESVNNLKPSTRRTRPSPVRCTGDCKRQVIDSVLGTLPPLLEWKFAAWQSGSGCTDGNEETSSGNTSSERTSKSPDSRSDFSGGGFGRGGRKRKIDQASGGPPGDDSNEPCEDDGSGKRSATERLRFACPFFKHDPATFRSSRACCGPGWETVHRVKEHIYRRHRQPLHRCNRCWEPFANKESLMEHQRATTPCQLRQPYSVAGIDDAQASALRSRKKTPTSDTEVGKWKAAYSIIFPEVPAEDIPSPFYDYENIPTEGTSEGERDRLECFSSYKDYLLPRLRSRLDEQLQKEPCTLEVETRKKAIDIVLDVQTEILREFRQVLSHSGRKAQAEGVKTQDNGRVATSPVNAQQQLTNEVFDTRLFQFSMQDFTGLEFLDPGMVLDSVEVPWAGESLEGCWATSRDGFERLGSDSAYGSKSTSYSVEYVPM